jgi:cell wall-associated NlpC family hydrolase
MIDSPRQDRRVTGRCRRGLAVVGVVTALLTLSPTLATIASAESMSAKLPAAVAIPNVDPVAMAAYQALDQLRQDSMRFDRGQELSATYVRLRREVAELIADRLLLNADELEAAWADSDINHQTALIAALTQVGVPYKRFAMKPGVGFDCSGLTSFAWSQAGFSIPHNSTRQIRAADPRTHDTAQAGDLLRYPGHVMMWLGVGQAVIHSPQPRQFVEVKILNTRSMKRSTFGDPTE